MKRVSCSWVVGTFNFSFPFGVTNVIFQAIFENEAALSALLAAWDVTLPATLGYSHLNETARGALTRSINTFYFGNEATPTIGLDRQQLMNVNS